MSFHSPESLRIFFEYLLPLAVNLILLCLVIYWLARQCDSGFSHWHTILRLLALPFLPMIAAFRLLSAGCTCGHCAECWIREEDWDEEEERARQEEEEDDSW